MSSPFDRERPEKVLLVDGNNLLSRATYAYDARSPNADAEQHIAGSVMLWLNSLRRYVRSERPDRVGICFDPPHRPAWRAQVCPTYKANRTADGVGTPVSYAVVLTHLLGLDPREHPEAEADDLVAGLTETHVEMGHEVVIVSADKDLLQCLRYPNVGIRRPGVAPEWWDAKQVERKYGVTADRWALYQALRGDTGDGIPGVRGIGKKRAVAILNEVDSDDITSHPKLAEVDKAEAFWNSLEVVRLPGRPELYEGSLQAVDPVVGCRDAQGMTATGVLEALGLHDEAELVATGSFWA